MKKLFSLMVLALLAIAGVRAHDLPTIKQLNKMIEAGDTVPESGMYNMFVINGATIPPEVLDSSYFVFIENLAVVSAPDSYCCMRFKSNLNSMAAAKKSYVSKLFPNAQEFVVNGEKATREQFDRIPASLLLSVTGTDNGRKLTVETRGNVNDPSTAFEALIEGETKWVEKYKELLPLQQIPDAAKIVINDFSSYPDGTYFSIDGLLRSAGYVAKKAPADISSISITYCDGVNVAINSPTFTAGFGDQILRVPSEKYPSMKLADFLSETKGAPAGCVILEKDTVYILPCPSKPIMEDALQRVMEDAMSKMEM